MSTKEETIYGMSGIVMDALMKAIDLDIQGMDDESREVAKEIYNNLLPPYRAILTDRDGNIIGSVDLIGFARLGLVSEIAWQEAVYKGLGVGK